MTRKKNIDDVQEHFIDSYISIFDVVENKVLSLIMKIIVLSLIMKIIVFFTELRFLHNQKQHETYKITIKRFVTMQRRHYKF
jgi:hypothetical protein